MPRPNGLRLVRPQDGRGVWGWVACRDSGGSFCSPALSIFRGVGAITRCRGHLAGPDAGRPGHPQGGVDTPHCPTNDPRRPAGKQRPAAASHPHAAPGHPLRSRDGATRGSCWQRRALASQPGTGGVLSASRESRRKHRPRQRPRRPPAGVEAAAGGPGSPLRTRSSKYSRMARMATRRVRCVTTDDAGDSYNPPVSGNAFVLGRYRADGPFVHCFRQ